MEEDSTLASQNISGHEIPSDSKHDGDPFPTTAYVNVSSGTREMTETGNYHPPRADRIRPLISSLFVQHRRSLVGISNREHDVNHGLQNILEYLKGGGLISDTSNLREVNAAMTLCPRGQALLISIVNTSHEMSRDARVFVNYCTQTYGERVVGMARDLVKRTKGCPLGRAGFKHIMIAFLNPASIKLTYEDWYVLFQHVFEHDDVPSLRLMYSDVVTYSFSLAVNGSELQIAPGDRYSIDYSSKGNIVQTTHVEVTMYVVMLALLYFTDDEFDVTRNEGAHWHPGYVISYWLTPINEETRMVLALNMSEGLAGPTSSLQATAFGATAKTFWRNARTVFDWVALLVDGVTPKGVCYGPRTIPAMRDGHPMRFAAEFVVDGVVKRDVELSVYLAGEANAIAIAAVICQQYRWSDSFMTLAKQIIQEMYYNWRTSWIQAAVDTFKRLRPDDDYSQLSMFERATMMFNETSMQPGNLGDHFPLISNAALFLLQTTGLDVLLDLNHIPLILYDANDAIGIDIFGEVKDSGARIKLKYS